MKAVPFGNNGAFERIELSHTIEVGMRTYPGLPPPRSEVLLDYESSRAKYDGRAEFLICAFWLCGNTGTYVDAPIHRHRGAADLAQLPLDRLAHVPIELVDGARAIDGGALRGRSLRDKAAQPSPSTRTPCDPAESWKPVVDECPPPATPGRREGPDQR
jgi:hypothetical protein